VFGPENVMLQPDEQFTVLYLSGGRPKREGAIKCMTLMLGPDFMTDVFEVETMDHARLSLTLSYTWYFDVNKEDEESSNKIFRVKDFVGDACKNIASRVRGMCSSRTFDDFHKHSSELIHLAVFGREAEQGKAKMQSESNNLVITNVDV
jgi:major vault protein